MSDRIRWTDRTFHFGFPAALYPEMLARLRGTPARIEDLVKGLSKEVLTRREGDAWSMQENIGHLADLEELVQGRLDDYDAGIRNLRAADMSNRRTHEARHNERPIKTVLSDFRRQRAKLMERLEALEPERFSRSAVHPRLKQAMRLVDMLYFQAEHDDYHLTGIYELRRRFA